MTRWSRAGAEPGDLPYQDVDASGTTWCDLANNSDGRSACGWGEASEPPSYDPALAALAWANGTWVLTPLPVPDVTDAIAAARAARLDALADVRGDAAATVRWRGAAWPADTGTKATLLVKRHLSMLHGCDAGTVLARWRLAAGAPRVPLTAEDIDELLAAIDLHVEACFDREGELATAIAAAGDVVAIAAVDIMADWPD